MELHKTQIDNLVKGNSERYLFEVKDQTVNETEKSITHLISTDDVDRGFDIMMQAGCDWTEFEKTKTFFIDHNYGLKGGHSAWLKFDNKADPHGILSKSIFADTQVAQDEYILHRDGHVNNWSIGFRIKKGADGFNLPDACEWADGNSQLRKILKWDLLEYSSTGIPMNTNAIDIIKSVCKSDYYKNVITKTEERLEFNLILKTYDDKIKELNELLTAKADKKDIEEIIKNISNKSDVKFEAETFKEMLAKSLKESNLYKI
jgi:hypothetical protein